MKIKSVLLGAAAAVMAGVSFAVPSMGQRHTPSRAELSRPLYNGDGKRVKPKVHPRHNATSDGYLRRQFADNVHATHSVDRKGNRQIDPRDDKYLHSHARAMRGLVKALDARAA